VPVYAEKEGDPRSAESYDNFFLVVIASDEPVKVERDVADLRRYKVGNCIEQLG
jgi:hypothetical protein